MGPYSGAAIFVGIVASCLFAWFFSWVSLPAGVLFFITYWMMAGIEIFCNKKIFWLEYFVMNFWLWIGLIFLLGTQCYVWAFFCAFYAVGGTFFGPFLVDRS